MTSHRISVLFATLRDGTFSRRTENPSHLLTKDIEAPFGNKALVDARHGRIQDSGDPSP
jgi:hypothetical protein